MMESNRMEPANAHHRKRVRHHLHEALDATDYAEKHFYIREALQLLSIEER